MNTIVQAKLIEIINQLAQSLGVATNKVIEVLVKQMVVEGLVYSVMGGVFLVTALVLLIISVRSLLTEGEKPYSEQRESVGVIAGAGTVFCIIAIVISLITLPENVMKAANPEYYALSRVMDMISPSHN